MKLIFSNQRMYASLLVLGASVLIFRTVRMMLVESAFEILVPWVIGMLITEFLIALGCALASIKWLISADHKDARLPLRLGAVAAIMHAIGC